MFYSILSDKVILCNILDHIDMYYVYEVNSKYVVILQVFPGAWTAVLISLDNVGIWNIRAENLDTWYLGQETYVKVVNPEPTNKTELPIPENALFCGALSKLQKYGLQKLCNTMLSDILRFLS